jgi:hypothetical protein
MVHIIRWSDMHNIAQRRKAANHPSIPRKSQKQLGRLVHRLNAIAGASRRTRPRKSIKIARLIIHSSTATARLSKETPRPMITSAYWAAASYTDPDDAYMRGPIRGLGTMARPGRWNAITDEARRRVRDSGRRRVRFVFRARRIRPLPRVERVSVIYNFVPSSPTPSEPS